MKKAHILAHGSGCVVVIRRGGGVWRLGFGSFRPAGAGVPAFFGGGLVLGGLAVAASSRPF